MKQRMHVIFFILNFIYFSLSFSQEIELEKIIVTPSRLEEKSQYIENNIEILNRDFLENRDNFNHQQIFNFINGLNLVGAGRFGSLSEGIFIRGAQPRHTAYMLEGIKIYDPSNPSSYYMPADFSLSGLERVEIVKTPLSSLYGSSPMGGVVNFLVKRPQTKPYIYLQTKGGSFYTAEEILELGGKLDILSYLFNIARLDTKGFSNAREKNNNPEKDPYQNTNILLNLNYNPEEELELGFITKAIHSRKELDDDDNWDGIPEDDQDNIGWNNELINTIYLKQKLSEIFSYKIQTGHTTIYRKTCDDTEEYVRDWYRGKTYQFLSNIEYKPFEVYKFIVGFDYMREKVENYANYSNYIWSLKQTNHTKGFFWENIFTPLDYLRIDGSFRREKNPLFKYHSVGKGSVSYKISGINTILYGSYSEGFKAPSIYQLYSSSGNRALKPEESETWELGFSQPLGNKLDFSLTYFHSDFRNLIDFVYIDPSLYLGRYENAAKAKSRGIELEMNYKPTSNLRFKIGYTYLKGKQDFVDEDFVTIFSHSLIRVPKHSTFLGFVWDNKKMNVSFDLSYIDRRSDRIWVGFFDEFVVMKPYLLGNLFINYNFSQNSSFFLNFNNIFDKDYERIKGYQEERAAVYVGLKTKF